MDNSNKIIPPHLNAEVYRTDTTGTTTQSYLDYIRTHSDGSVLVGGSELTGRYWDGSVRIFKKNSDNVLNLSTRKDICLTSGTPDGCFVESSCKVLLCEDTGSLSLWSSNDDAWKIWTEELSVSEHDEAIMGIECLQPGSEYITVGADGNIKVWDITDLVCARNYRNAHSAAIYALAVRPTSHSNFITGSLDYYISLWDDNTNNSVLDVLKNDCGIRCLQWINENQVVYGDEAGIVGLIDVRQAKNCNKVYEFPAAVHKLAVSSEMDHISVCCDNKIVSVFDISNSSKFSLIYENRNIHSNFVRNAAWDQQENNLLYTVGWDGELKTHKICNT